MHGLILHLRGLWFTWGVFDIFNALCVALPWNLGIPAWAPRLNGVQSMLIVYLPYTGGCAPGVAHRGPSATVVTGSIYQIVIMGPDIYFNTVFYLLK